VAVGDAGVGVATAGVVFATGLVAGVGLAAGVVGVGLAAGAVVDVVALVAGAGGCSLGNCAA
jgi:hypothetical protein